MKDIGNVGFVCPKHAPKPGGYVDRDPESLVGLFVKLGFEVPEADRPPTHEHMWVRINSYNQETKEFEGELNNNPVFIAEYQCGDGVVFTIEEIEDIYEKD